MANTSLKLFLWEPEFSSYNVKSKERTENSVCFWRKSLQHDLRHMKTRLHFWANGDSYLWGSSSPWQECLGPEYKHTVFSVVGWALKGATLPIRRAASTEMSFCKETEMNKRRNKVPVNYQLLFNINRQILSAPSGKSHHWRLFKPCSPSGIAVVIICSLRSECLHPAANCCKKCRLLCTPM